MRDEIAIGFKLLATLETGVHPKAMGTSQMLYHLLDGQLVDVAKVTRVGLVKWFDAELV
jgi:enoyl-CoA hydratase/carnithine racemase